MMKVNPPMNDDTSPTKRNFGPKKSAPASAPPIIRTASINERKTVCGVKRSKPGGKTRKAKAVFETGKKAQENFLKAMGVLAPRPNAQSKP
jgi:hypothetical protein